ncbi:MAG: ABC transporter ATP-binding protein [bacterium]|nr:ABC transporter ATP-binding protein [bacterium]
MSLIEVKNLQKIYEDDVETPALNGVSFKVEKGEFIAIMGPSGSGKSTLLNILGFLDKPTKGDYLFENKSMNEYTNDELAQIRNKKMGFIFQSFNLLPRTNVFENVKLPLVYSGIEDNLWDEMVNKAIDAVGLSHRTVFESTKLSGGEKQRVAIARALILKPDVIFADEPTGNLDSKSGQKIMEIIQRLNEEYGHTIILITHETYTAEHAQRIIKIIDGAIESDVKVEHQHHATDHFEK